MAITGIVLAALPPLAAQSATAANVLVVVNTNSSVSRNIGEYYARRRSIPMNQVCRIQTSTAEAIPRAEYEQQIAKPVAQCLRAIQGTESILYIATTLGVPLSVNGTNRNDGASVDSELTLLYGDMRGSTPHATTGALPNPLYGKREARFAHPQFPMYLVTRLAAYDFPTVRAMIDRCLVARNVGKFVIDLRSSDDTSGDSWLLNAAIRLPQERVILDRSSTVLYDQRQVIGYASWGSNDGNRKQRFTGFEWLPGAIATEFVSTDGRTLEQPPKNWNISDWKSKDLWFAGSPQTMSADFLMEGASGASGHVDEPYLAGTPRPELLLPAYFQGRTLAESYWLAIPTLSWQNVVLGDPLCSLGPPR